ncbi:hypothetical protein HYH03_014064 [Edaphochlamys debaryana]|uniref:Fe2OG dioxygenase domain-containing protein n=1 Tax=Edaphochlamys debaryana TaxID=47281 RepID=A0A835XPN6_9CHLO|nr:hypothetical protein HYH03_014064 [Edaphochlamys debaryana]|eukprot:KAG2487350.1 hypothetical protein HYH03_014064 [Edaphochlamys debaryana]
MAQKRDSKWLEQELSRALGWDDMIVHALVEAVQQAAAPGGNRSDLDDMIQNFLAESPKGVQLINDYLAAAKAPGGGGGGGSSTGAGGTAGGSRGAPAAAAARAAAPAPKPAPAPAAAAPPARSYAASTAPAAAVTKPYQPAMGGQQAVAPAGWEPLTASANAAGGAAGPSGGGGGGGGDDFSRFVSDEPGKGGRGGGRGGSKPGSSRDLQALEASAASPEPSPEGAKVLGMFKAGGRIKAPSAKPVGMRGPDLAATLEKKILNCLGCGKIYDCRNVTNDILRFLDRGGVCTYCGDTVPLTLKDRQNAAAAAAAADGADGAARDQAAATPEEAAAAAARAFKDRLVEYDRNAAKRTTVIDDQSDFFEIDTNAWLTDQEREELRRRRRMEEEAEAARRKRLTVTIDLIGRKVVLDEDVRKAEEEQARKAAERTAAAARAAAAAAALRNTDGDDAAAGSAYGGGVSFKGNALGGKAAGPTKEQLDAALSALRNMKATANPALASTAAPLFLPAAGAPPGGEGKGKGGEEGAGGGGGGGGSKRTGPGAAAARPKKGPARGIPLVCSRLQAGEDEFDAFGAEVVLDELMGGALMAAADAEEGPYDICPPDMAPSTSYSVAATLAPAGPPKAVPGLPPGLVVIKGYLKMDEQIKIVRMIRELGMGTGGFYVPSYSSGGRLNLHMMCLGLHWEPRTSKYEATRSSYDGATPPTLPKELSDLCARALAAATAASAAAGGPRLPPLKPDICLANFYERQGKLGMHQDKDEQPDSLKAGLPVVSFSIGDSADFLYGRTRDADQAECVRLESGDLLVFGGPSRMLFHAVPKIHPHTAPAELVRGCGLRPGRLNLTFRQYSAS